MEALDQNIDPPKVSPKDFSKKIKEKYPEYKNVDDVTLAKKMIEKYPEYSNRVNFETNTPLKKKEPSEPNMDSNSENGSLDSSKNKANYFGKANTNSLISDVNKLKTDVGENSRESILRNKLNNAKVTLKNMDEVSADTTELQNILNAKKPNEIAIKKQKELEKEPDFFEKYTSFINNTTHLQKQNDSIQADEELKSELNDQEWTDYLIEGAKKVANQGIKVLNTPVNLFTGRSVADKEYGTRSFEISPFEEKKPLEKQLKESDNYFLELKKEAQRKKEPIPTFSKEERLEKAKELYIKEKIDSYIYSRQKDYLQELDDQDGGVLQSKFADFKKGELASLDEKEKTLLNKQAVQEVTHRRLQTEIENLQERAKKEGKTPELEQAFSTKIAQYKQVEADGLETINQYVFNRENIGNATDNLDVLKRNYSLLSNITGNIRTSTESLGAGVFGALDYGANAISMATGLESGGAFKSISQDLENASQNTQSKIEKSLSFDNINSLSDLGDWFVNDGVSKQVPVFAAVATGTYGVAALGISSLGTKYEEMQGEVARGEKKYTNTELMLHPFGYGLTETASAMVDLMILKNAGRVVASATAAERTLIAGGMWNGAKSFGKELMSESFKGGISETFDEMGTQGMQNLIDGKSFTDGMKDAGAAGGAMGFMIPFLAVNFKHTIKNFSTDSQIQKETAKSLAFQIQLDNLDLDADTKDIIKNNLSKSKEKTKILIEKVIGDITSLSNEQFQEIVGLEKTQTNLKSQAEKIKFDDNLEDGMKKQILSNLQVEFKANDQRRLDLLERGANVQLERLDNKEVENVSLTDEANKLEIPINVEDNPSEKLLVEDEVAPEPKSIFNDKETAIAEIKSKNLTRVRGLNMGLNQAIGTYISTEDTNRYGTAEQAKKMDVSIENPLVTNDTGLLEARKQTLQESKEQFTAEDFQIYELPKNNKYTIDDLNDTGIKKLAELTTNKLKEQGYDSIYFPESETQEGELVVFDRSKAVYVTESKANIKRIKSLKDADYDVEFDENNNVKKIKSVKDGREIPKFVERTIIDKKTGVNKKVLVKNANYSRIEADALGLDTDNKTKTDRKKELDNTINSFEPNNEYEHALLALASGEKVSLESIQKEIGNKDGKWATNQSSKIQLPSIEVLSEQIWNNNNNLNQTEVRNALIDIINSNSSLEQVKNSIFENYNENAKKLQEEELQVFLGNLSEKDLAMYQFLKAEDSYFEELTDKEVYEYYNKQYEEYEQGQREYAKSETTNEKSENPTASNEGQARERKTSESTQEVTSEKSFIDEITDFSDGASLLDFLDKLKFNNDGNINSFILPIPQLYNAFVEAVKLGVKGGLIGKNLVDFAINKLKSEYAAEQVKELTTFLNSQNNIPNAQQPEPTTQNNKNFTREQGKKSLLNRLAEGKNSKEITDAIIAKGLTYDVRNQEKSDREAIALINEIGIAEAYIAIKSNIIEKNDIKALVYNEIIQRLPAEIDTELESIPDLKEYTETKEKLLNEFAKISSEYNDFVENLGQGISILNYIYNKNGDLKYELSRQINRHKNENNGQISEETIAKFKKADETIKELNNKIKAKQEEIDLLNAQQALQNIIEQQTRNNKKKLSNTQAKNLANKVRELKINRPGIFRASVGVDLIWDGAIETVATSIELGGSLAIAIQKGVNYIKNSKWYKNLSDSDKNTAEHEFRDFYNNNEILNLNDETAYIDVNGKVKVPLSQVVSFIENGVTDINEISEKIYNDLKSENPDVTVRNVRDAITGYGNTVNKTKKSYQDDLLALKNLGKLLSQKEDLENNIAKTKKEINKRKLSEQEKLVSGQIKQIKKDLGITENERTENSKNNTKKRIEQIKKKIAEQDYAKKELLPIQEDAELKKLKSEKLEQQEIFDKDQYENELRNRTKIQKVGDVLIQVWNIPRVLIATGEMSWLLIQGGTQTISSPIRAFKAAKIMIKAMGSQKYADNWERELKSSEYYDIMVKSGLALTQANYKASVKEEQFVSDYASLVWDLPGMLITENQKLTGVGRIKKLFKKELTENDYKNLRNQWKDNSPLRVLERGNSSYLNQMRVNRFLDGVKMLNAEGKNIIEHKEDFKKVASVVNTLTGRASIGSLQNQSQALGVVFFSFRNWVSKVNMLNPYYYASLNNFSNKPSVAQKIMVTDMLKFVSLTATTMYLIKAAAGDDEEGNPICTIETDFRSSDFLKLKLGEIRIDPWGGLQSSATFFTRIITDQSKSTKTGDVTTAGETFGSRTRDMVGIDYVTGKFNPSTSLAWNFMKSKKDVDDSGKEIRVDKFGNEYDPFGDMSNFQPIYWSAIEQVRKEQPGLVGDFIIATGLLGISFGTYQSKKDKIESTAEAKPNRY